MYGTWHAICEASTKASKTGMGEHVLQFQGAAQSGQMSQDLQKTKKAKAHWALKEEYKKIYS